MKLKLLVGLCCVAVFAGFAFHSSRMGPMKAKEAWKTGYWIWAGEPPVTAGFEPEILYVDAPGSRWPRDLPEAAEYVIVRRMESSALLNDETASALAADYKAVIEDAGDRVTITGLQIDYDSPTNKLDAYARFLRRVREKLPPNHRLSITALLDWFTPHTDVRNALKWVDEYVPQFYDSRPVREAAGIAEPVDPVKWGRVFDSYQTPYRIGIASFGRIARRRTDPSGRTEVRYFRDAGPLDFMGRQFIGSTGTTKAGEFVVHYEVTGEAGPPGKLEVLAGDTVDITFPTEASVRAAYDAAHHFGSYCAGVLFFRWPNRNESLTLPPDDVLQIISGRAVTKPALEVRTPPCLERPCADLYLDLGSGLHPGSRTLGIHATGPLELFFPAGPLQPKPVGPDRIAVEIPAYAGFGKVYLGRTISRSPVQFEVISQ